MYKQCDHGFTEPSFSGLVSIWAYKKKTSRVLQNWRPVSSVRTVPVRRLRVVPVLCIEFGVQLLSVWDALLSSATRLNAGYQFYFDSKTLQLFLRVIDLEADLRRFARMDPTFKIAVP